MTLVVLGKESLSQLQGAVSGMFAPVPNRGSGRRPSEKWIGKVKPFFNTQPLQAYNIVPVQVRALCVCVLCCGPILENAGCCRWR